MCHPLSVGTPGWRPRQAAARERALSGSQQAEARRILGAINGSGTFKYRME
jgi:hypothetical protein